MGMALASLAPEFGEGDFSYIFCEFRSSFPAL